MPRTSIRIIKDKIKVEKVFHNLGVQKDKESYTLSIDSRSIRPNPGSIGLITLKF